MFFDGPDHNASLHPETSPEDGESHLLDGAFETLGSRVETLETAPAVDTTKTRMHFRVEKHLTLFLMNRIFTLESKT
jgi:hypothetical protein